MCGPENTNRPRGGALAVLSPCNSDNDGHQLQRPGDLPSLGADLAFHTPGSPASDGATHARLTPTTTDHGVTSLADLFVFIQ